MLSRQPAPTQGPGPVTGSVRPFGLTTALPARAQAPSIGEGLSLCPQRQVTVVTDTGEPAIHAPSMKSQFLTTSQTQEDMQLATDTDNDTD
ncbi:hypothetical protein AQ490_11785 [Wenjunlia vitaminophila]|uniref:ATP-grasp-modified RiPP n=2 Tax=Wenjunlia vitaminophila TaxID=76728 RepID=A0A0T6LLN7_WENVI|nr:hypothetical protein AQ490_11785 [Wenjunlia vitaminophila]